MEAKPENQPVPTPSPDGLKVALRYVLTILGVLMAKHGWADEASWLSITEALTGIVLTVGPGVWAYVDRYLAAKRAAAHAAASLTEDDLKRLIKDAIEQSYDTTVAEVIARFNERQEKRDAPTLAMTGVGKAPVTPNITKGGE